MTRRLFQKIHLIVALGLCLPLVAQGLTGSALVFRGDIENFLNPPPRYVVAASTPHTIAAVVAAARRVIPVSYAPSFYEAPANSSDLARVQASTPRMKQPPIIVWIDPVSLRVVRVEKLTPGPFDYITTWHTTLFLGPAGNAIVGCFGIALLTLSLTGPILWFPRGKQWRHAFGVSRAAKGFRFYRELHGAVGFWALLLLLLTSLTGISLAFPAVPGAIGHLLTPGSRAAARPTFSKLPPNAGIAPGSAIFIDPRTGSILQIRYPKNSTAAEKFVSVIKPIHTGEIIGGLWRFPVFLVGFLPLLFTVTGVNMWLIKRRAHTRSSGRVHSGMVSNR